MPSHGNGFLPTHRYSTGPGKQNIWRSCSRNPGICSWARTWEKVGSEQRKGCLEPHPNSWWFSVPLLHNWGISSESDGWGSGRRRNFVVLTKKSLCRNVTRAAHEETGIPWRQRWAAHGSDMTGCVAASWDKMPLLLTKRHFTPEQRLQAAPARGNPGTGRLHSAHPSRHTSPCMCLLGSTGTQPSRMSLFHWLTPQVGAIHFFLLPNFPHRQNTKHWGSLHVLTAAEVWGRQVKGGKHSDSQAEECVIAPCEAAGISWPRDAASWAPMAQSSCWAQAPASPWPETRGRGVVEEAATQTCLGAAQVCVWLAACHSAVKHRCPPLLTLSSKWTFFPSERIPRISHFSFYFFFLVPLPKEAITGVTALMT